jgi:hypothetical protein
MSQTVISRKGLFLAAAFVLATAHPALAQRVELSGILGWTFSDGVSTDTGILAADGNIYDRVDPKDSFSWGFMAGVYVTPNVEVGFRFNNQESNLQIDGSNTFDLGGMDVTTYHGYFAYNFGESDAMLRPYVMIGFGATNYSDVNFRTPGNLTGTINGETQYSSTWGVGVKAYPSPNFGVRFGLDWTPTYIKSDAAGWWCDPFWGCYVVGSAQYSNQWQLNGGISVRF